MRTIEDEIRDRLSYDPSSGLLTWVKAVQTRWPAGRVVTALSDEGYVVVRVKNRRFRAHRVAWLLQTGQWPENEIDHINLDKSDNRWSNLRAASRQENSANTPLRSTSRVGLKGVRRSGKSSFVAMSSGVYLGSYKTAEEAHAVYLAKAKERYGDFSRKA